MSIVRKRIIYKRNIICLTEFATPSADPQSRFIPVNFCHIKPFLQYAASKRWDEFAANRRVALGRAYAFTLQRPEELPRTATATDVAAAAITPLRAGDKAERQAVVEK
jgi:hypothetical protein